MPDTHARTDVRRLVKLAGVPLAAAAAIAVWPEEDLRGAAPPPAITDGGDATALLREGRRLSENDLAARIEGFARHAGVGDRTLPRSPFGRPAEQPDEKKQADELVAAEAERAAEAEPTPPPPPPVVTAVIATGSGGVAWVGGRRVTVGDEVGGYVIVAIDADGVRARLLPPGDSSDGPPRDE